MAATVTSLAFAVNTGTAASLTTDAAVTDAPVPKKPAPPMPGGGEDYDY